MVHVEMDPPSNSNKRRKTSVNANAGLSFLPDGVLASVGEYLALPSRALLAVALTAPSSSWAKRHWIGGPSAAGQAAMPPGGVTALDFEEVEEDLAVRLSDDDLGAILACAGVHTLHTLKLANCLGITSRGLEPLRGSTTLKFIDLSLVGKNKTPQIDEEGVVLSEAPVISVLQSIIDAEGNALRYLALPSHWKADKSESLTQFHRHYAEHLYSKSPQCAGENCRSENGPGGPPREYRCDECSHQPCLCSFAWFADPDWDCEGAFQRYTCYECEEIFCEDCCCNRGELSCCDECEKQYCTKCEPMTLCCEGCFKASCSGCDHTTACKICHNVYCADCNDEGMTKCGACGEGICNEHRNWGHTNDEGEDLIFTCSDCKRTLCIDCCKYQHCGTECFSMICNDCQPKGWECLWCDKDDPDAYVDNFVDEYERRGIRCTGCFDRAKTHCHYCRKVKLREEDYLAPHIPSSHWTSRGYDESYVESMEHFLHEMKKATLQLLSGDTLDDGITLEGANGIVLRHNDILLPHWQEFAEALRQYDIESRRRLCFRLSNVELHSSVFDMLDLALKAKTFRALELQNVASSANGIKFATGFVRNNPKLDRLDMDGFRVDSADRLRRLFAAIADHQSLKFIRLESICGSTMNGHDLLPLAFSLLRGRGLHRYYPLLRATKRYEIDLGSNNIRTNGATDLPDVIATNNLRLKSLRLAHNQLDDSDALQIAEALKQNTTLEFLDLGGNNITEGGRDALGRVVCDCTSVKSVVSSNHTCFISGLEFASALCNYNGPSSTTIQRKIYRLFSIRNKEGSNCRHLDSELGDNLALKLAPDVLKRVMHLYPYGHYTFDEYGKDWERRRTVEVGIVLPLSLLYEIVRSWKLPCHEE